MAVDLSHLSTEARLASSKHIDEASTLEIIKIINDEDKKIAYLIEKELDNIAKVVDLGVVSLRSGGRIIYVGAGTSGRIGLMDAVEIPPTYGDDESFKCLLAGGESAFVKAKEGAEDNSDEGREGIAALKVGCNDLVIGLAASGRTPFVIGALEEAKNRDALTSCIVTTPSSPIEKMVDAPIVVVTGAEVVSGSTRMKAGTAQKMICNMLSTAMMIKMGKVYENLMVDVKATNAKLIERSYKIIMEVTGLSREEAISYFEKYHTVKKAIFSVLSNEVRLDVIDEYLEKAKGNLKEALKMYQEER